MQKKLWESLGMTLVECRECGNDISKRADKCPHCGAPGPARSRLKPKPIGCGTIVAALSLAIVILSRFNFYSPPNSSSNSGTDTGSPTINRPLSQAQLAH